MVYLVGISSLTVVMEGDAPIPKIQKVQYNVNLRIKKIRQQLRVVVPIISYLRFLCRSQNVLEVYGYRSQLVGKKHTPY